MNSRTYIPKDLKSNNDVPAPVQPKHTAVSVSYLYLLRVANILRKTASWSRKLVKRATGQFSGKQLKQLILLRVESNPSLLRALSSVYTELGISIYLMNLSHKKHQKSEIYYWQEAKLLYLLGCKRIRTTSSSLASGSAVRYKKKGAITTMECVQTANTWGWRGSQTTSYELFPTEERNRAMHPQGVQHIKEGIEKREKKKSLSGRDKR